jgi:serine/threonine protein kinase
VGIFSSLKRLFVGGGKKKGKKKLPRIRLSSRFELLGTTGQGSMSKVWRARDNKLGRTVCLKILDKVKTAKFEQRWVGLNKPLEGEILMELPHKNIVKTYEYGLTTDGEQYIVMELIEGPGLNYLIETRSERLQGNRVELLVQAAEALDFIHKKGYLHRDICPRNMMVTNDGTLKYIDFGLAIPNRPEFLKPGNRTGTPNYLAPEVIKRVTTDHRVDLFALGVTAYEVFTGVLPWEQAQSVQVLMNHMNIEGKNPREVRPDLDEAVYRFLLKAIEREPKKRFQTAAHFRDALLQLPDPERW